MSVIRSGIREALLQMYGEEVVSSVEKMNVNCKSLKYLCEFASQWYYITNKLKMMYGEKLANVTLVPISNDLESEE